MLGSKNLGVFTSRIELFDLQDSLLSPAVRQFVTDHLLHVHRAADDALLVRYVPGSALNNDLDRILLTRNEKDVLSILMYIGALCEIDLIPGIDAIKFIRDCQSHLPEYLFCSCNDWLSAAWLKLPLKKSPQSNEQAHNPSVGQSLETAPSSIVSGSTNGTAKFSPQPTL